MSWVRQITQTQHISKDYKRASGGVPPWYQRVFAYGKGDASTSKG